jgi:hypothetical protein
MPCYAKRATLLIAFGVFAYLPLLQAQQTEPNSVPACESVADDADGDGTGVTPNLFEEHDCVITEQTTPHPLQVAIGGQLSRYTQRRNKWNPAVDLVNREIECTNYTWNSESGSFAVEDIFTITHHPLANDAPHMGEYEIRVSVNGEIMTGTGLWRSVDGRYVSADHTTTTGKTLKLHADPWGETIRFQNDQSGMRFWNMNSRDPQDSSVIVASATQDCRYTSGDTFEPTGHLEEETSGEIVVTIGVPPTLVQLPSSVPEIINPETGSVVPLRPLYFKLERDLLQQQMWCTDYTWQVDAFTPVNTKPDGYLFMPPLPGEDTGSLYVDHQQQGTFERFEWWTEDTTLHTTSGFVVDAWYEPTAAIQDDFKVWHPDTNPATYSRCVVETQVEQYTTLVTELPVETEIPTNEQPDSGANQNETLPVSNENTNSPDNSTDPSEISTDSDTESTQTATTAVVDPVQISGGGSLYHCSW